MAITLKRFDFEKKQNKNKLMKMRGMIKRFANTYFVQHVKTE